MVVQVGMCVVALALALPPRQTHAPLCTTTEHDFTQFTNQHDRLARRCRTKEVRRWMLRVARRLNAMATCTCLTVCTMPDV